jgi:LSD1 subclass zinc finger protein
LTHAAGGSTAIHVPTGATSARCSACRRHATRCLEDAEGHRYAARKARSKQRGVARVDSQACEGPHVAVRLTGKRRASPLSSWCRDKLMAVGSPDLVDITACSKQSVKTQKMWGILSTARINWVDSICRDYDGARALYQRDQELVVSRTYHTTDPSLI